MKKSTMRIHQYDNQRNCPLSLSTWFLNLDIKDVVALATEYKCSLYVDMAVLDKCGMLLKTLLKLYSNMVYTLVIPLTT